MPKNIWDKVPSFDAFKELTGEELEDLILGAALEAGRSGQPFDVRGLGNRRIGTGAFSTEVPVYGEEHSVEVARILDRATHRLVQAGKFVPAYTMGCATKFHVNG